MKDVVRGVSPISSFVTESNRVKVMLCVFFHRGPGVDHGKHRFTEFRDTLLTEPLHKGVKDNGSSRPSHVQTHPGTDCFHGLQKWPVGRFGLSVEGVPESKLADDVRSQPGAATRHVDILLLPAGTEQLTQEDVYLGDHRRFESLHGSFGQCLPDGSSFAAVFTFVQHVEDVWLAAEPGTEVGISFPDALVQVDI